MAALSVVVGGDQVQGLLIAAQGGVEVLQKNRLGLARSRGVIESFQGDPGERAEVPGAAEPVAVGAQAEAALKPLLGLVQVLQLGHQLVGVAEVASALGFSLAVTDPLTQRESLLKVRQATRVVLVEEEHAEVVEGNG